jgi:hypothetical protein
MSDGLHSAFPPSLVAPPGVSASPGAEADPAGEGAGRLTMDVVGVASPLPRWPDGRAELPALRAQLRRAERRRDSERERRVAASLSRALVKRRCELDIAVRLARRAVLLGDDSLRMELSSWHCQLGHTALAVGMLAPLL